MKQHLYLYAIMALMLFAACIMGGCSATANQTQDESAAAEQIVSQTAEDTVEPPIESTSEDVPSSEISVWSKVSDFSITHASNIAGFLNDQFGITVGYSGEVHYSNDAGQTWLEGENSSMCLFCLDIVDENIAWAGGNGDNVRITRDGGKTWTEVSDVALGTTHSNIDFVDDTTGWIATLSKLAATQDGGQTWTEMALPEDGASIAAICLRTAEDGYLLTPEGMLFTTSDGGTTWSGQDLGLADYHIVNQKQEVALNKSNIAIADISFSDENNGSIVFTSILSEGGYATYVLTTTDGGQSWESELLSDIGINPAKVFLSGDSNFLTLSDFTNNTVVMKRN